MKLQGGAVVRFGASDRAWQSPDVEVIDRLKGLVPHFFADGKLVCSRWNQVVAIPDLSAPKPELLFEIPQVLSDRLARVRLLDRVLKRSIAIVHASSDGGYLIMAGGQWWRISSHGDVQAIESPGDTMPMHRGICSSPDGTTYVAEYRSNPERSAVRIFATRDHESFHVARSFEAGSVRHVHAIIADPVLEGRIWVMTGDNDRESRIHWTEDGFRSLETLLSAGQTSRGVDMIIDGDELVWGMDSPMEPSYVCRMHLSGQGGVRKERRLEGPAYYMTRNEAGGIYLGTTVEEGPAVVDRMGRIVGLRPGGAWEDLFRFSKDMVPQHGMYYLPRGILPGNFIVFSQRALVPYEGWMTVARDRAWGS